jgi:hypothetical protein
MIFFIFYHTAKLNERSVYFTSKEFLDDKEDARMLIKRICTSEANIIPDKENKTISIQLHHQASKSQDAAAIKLCEELNETETIFPGSNMKEVYKLV